MPNVNLKTDFKNGNKLYAEQLNNNFELIKEAFKDDSLIITPTLNVGNVETTEEPQASITGTAPDFILNLGLPKGEDGTGITIFGSYNTEEELKTAHPIGKSGDSYLVQNNLYIWSTNTSEWVNVGEIKGPPGTTDFNELKNRPNIPDVNNMGSIVVDDISCKNLFNINNLTLGAGGIDYSTGTITVNQYATGSVQTLKQLVPDLKVGETYTVSLTTSGNNKFIYLIGSETVWYSGTPHVMTQAELDSGIIVYGDYDNPTMTVTIKDIQIEKGTTATPFTPYKALGYTSGSNENGSWVKYDDGRMECFSRKTFLAVPIQTAWGTMYESASLNLGDYPIPFVDIPYVQITPNGRFLASVITAPSTTSYGTFRAVRPATAEGMDITVSIEAKGYWK